jgi:hypothetical protein
VNFFSFLQTRYRTQFYVAVLVFVGLVTLAFFHLPTHQTVSWLDPIIGLATFVFAVFLWLNGLRKEWEQSLPKRLTVQFEYEGRNVMICRDSLLANLADARTWALQIGNQMSSCPKLRFQPLYNFQDTGIMEAHAGKKYKSYIITYYLTQLPVPEPDNGTPEQNEKQKEDILWKLQNGCIEWIPEYSNDNTVTIVPGFQIKSGAKMTVADS